MAETNHDVLREAIVRNAGVVLSLPSAGLLRHHKSRFLADEGDAFWVESVPAEGPLLAELIRTQKPVGISFKSGVRKIVLTSPLGRLDPAFRVNAETVVEAVQLPYPEQVQSIQRRSSYRVKAYPDADLGISVWRIAERVYLGDRPMAAQAVAAAIRDLSIGGVGVSLTGKGGEPPKISAEDRLRIELTFRDVTILLEGHLRFVAPPAGDASVRAGIQFKALESNLDGRRKLAQLTRIVGELQREEIRRAKLRA